MHDADSKLEGGVESIYDYFWGSDANTLTDGPITRNPLQARILERSGKMSG